MHSEGKMTHIIHKDLCYQLNKIFFEVHNKLGRMLKEKQYADAIELLLRKYKILYEREKEIPILFEGAKIMGNRIDFIIQNIIPCDIKARKYISKEDYRQMQRYLKALNLKLGLIINFRDKSIRPKRVINPEGFE